MLLNRKSTIKFLTVSILTTAMTLGNIQVASANTVKTTNSYKTISNDLEDKLYINLHTTKININLLGEEYTDITAVSYAGRLYLPLKELEGLKIIKSDTTNKQNIKVWITDIYDDKYILTNQLSQAIPGLMLYNNEAYVNVVNLLLATNYTMVTDVEKNTITFYKKSNETINNLNSFSIYRDSEASESAYLRLEDIMADGLDKDLSKSYTSENLSKLRLIADILNVSGQQFYIAWISLYTNPRLGYVNNLLTSENLYNSDFLCTLDYLIARGGHIGLHGYTHQYGMDKSADGYEWGENTPLLETEQLQRMFSAIQTAEKLGFEQEFFEFPHYSATPAQLKMAEKLFTTIYQQHPSTDGRSIEVINGTKYVPTPAGYILYNGYTAQMLNILKQHLKEGKILSLFYHPTLDMNNIEYTYDEQSGTLSISGLDGLEISKLIKGVNEMQHRFTTF